MTTLLAFGFVLGVLVFFHELGHFLMARWHGVRVLTFSLGFGPKLLKVQRGDTEYCLSLVPLGGYVKMAGENPDDPRTGGEDEFLSKNKWQRFQILIMGPLMNLFLAVVLLAVVLMQGADVLAYLDRPATVGVVEPGSPAEAGGIKPGDLIVKVGTADVSNWEQLDMAVAARPEREVQVVVMRDGREEHLTLRPDLTTLRTRSNARFEVGTIGVLPDVNPTIKSVFSGQPAEAAGLKSGDIIVSINGKRMVFGSQVSEGISSNPDKPIEIVVRRADGEHAIKVTPVDQGGKGKIGIEISEATRSFSPTALEAISLSVQRNVEMSGQILRTIKELVTGEASPKQLMGPVGIAQLSGESAQAGWIALVALMATISLNLGLLNLLPIPVLDGGHIFIMGIETVARRNFSLQVKEKMLFVGFVLLMTLMVTVIYNDLTRIAWIEQLMPLEKLMRALAVVTLLALTAGPAFAQDMTQSDVQRLQDAVAVATKDVSNLRTRDANAARDLQAELNDMQEEVTYLKVKLRKERNVPRADYSDLRDRIENLQNRARGDDSRGGYSTPATAKPSTSSAKPTTASPSTTGSSTGNRTGANGLVVPVGTELDVRLQTALNSGTAQVEDRFEATTLVDLKSKDGRMLVPAGSLVRGVVSAVKPAGRVDRKGSLSLGFERITINGSTYQIRGTLTEAAESEGVKGEAAKIGTGAAVGGILGGILGGVKGTIAGILIGGGGTMVASEGEQVDLKVGTVLRMRFDDELSLER